MFARRFFLPYNVRGIPSGLLPTVMKQSLDETTATVVPTIASTSGPDSHSQPSSLEARLHTVLRSAGAGISLPLQHQDLACTSGLLALFFFLRLFTEMTQITSRCWKTT